MTYELKPCPFCGNAEDKRGFTYKFKNDKRKVNGIYYRICSLRCNGCTATVQQAGPTDELAEKYAINQWNRRYESEVVQT